MDSLIKFGAESSEDSSKILFNGIIERFLEVLRNKEGNLKMKKNILIILENIISNGIKINKINEIISIAKEIEKEGIRMMKKMDSSKEVRNEWKELRDAAHILQYSISEIDEEELEKEENSYLEIMEEMKKEIIEKEDIWRENLKLKKEIEEMKKQQKQNIVPLSDSSLPLPSSSQRQQDKKNILQIAKYDSISDLSLSFSDESKMNIEGNVFVHREYDNWETCIIGEEMEKVYFILYYYTKE